MKMKADLEEKSSPEAISGKYITALITLNRRE
jgi:hypothetical protein